MNDCLFCDYIEEPKVFENQTFYAIFDKYPVNQGHLLIISKRHVSDLFALNKNEFEHLYDIIKLSKEMLDIKYKPDGYNVGVNCGETAGQTIFHFHLHIIPRYEKDVENPRGGIRNIKKPIKDY